ncbi:MAG: DUF1684 domain-containing protein [Candidatus Kerfeldbacteria bacterium]|nr:DUF1684 domain-containing protein [Candidatus Kerfeldbacteria bacterium]
MDLKTLRSEKDQFFRSSDSPLRLDQRATFTGLRYFPQNPALRIRLPIDGNVAHDFVMMQTSTGSQRRYVRSGKISFTVNGQLAELSIFKDDHGYFLPFRDATGETETYPAGRYLEPEVGSDGLFEVDFNQAYNPYCAYNEEYSCPIPPKENWIPVRIEAGEKRFHE